VARLTPNRGWIEDIQVSLDANPLSLMEAFDSQYPTPNNRSFGPSLCISCERDMKHFSLCICKSSLVICYAYEKNI
jgi:hypothetical protein